MGASMTGALPVSPRPSAAWRQRRSLPRFATSRFPHQKLAAVFRAVITSLSYGFQTEHSLCSRREDTPGPDLTPTDLTWMVRNAGEVIPDHEQRFTELFRGVFLEKTVEQVLLDLEWTKVTRESGRTEAPLTLFSKTARILPAASPHTERVDAHSRSVRLSEHDQRLNDSRRLDRPKTRNIKSNLRPAMKKYSKIAKRRHRDSSNYVTSFNDPHFLLGQPDGGLSSGQTFQTTETAETAPENPPDVSEGEHSLLGEDDILRLMHEES